MKALKKRVERLRGMRDVLPDAYQQQHWLHERMSAFLDKAGYRTVDTPVLENSDLFLTSFGQELWQNLYTFRLRHRDLCLRPEYTASICRLYLDHYQQQSLPLRFQYAGPVFRHETPGRGRYRQYTQLGIELVGGQAPLADAEMVLLACDLLRDVAISHYRLELGHIGIASRFINRLQLDEQAAHLLLSLMEKISRSDEGERIAQARLEALYPTNGQDQGEAQHNAAGSTAEMWEYVEAHGVPSGFVTALLHNINVTVGDDDTRQEVIERFLWKMERREQRQRILHALEFLRALHAVSGAPPDVFASLHALLKRYELDPAPLTELQQLVDILEQCGIASQHIELNLALGRGVSYYTGLVFEIHAQGEHGSDTQLCGGGRYDHLMRAVGGSRDIKACGFALGIERLLPLIDPTTYPAGPTTGTLVIPVSALDIAYALQVAETVRAHGVQTEVDVTGHGVSAGIQQAVKKGIHMAVIVGNDERNARIITVRDLDAGEERVSSIETFAATMQERGL